MSELSLAAAAPLAENRLYYLDGWRGWAVTLVLLGHFLSIPGINFGTFGVELFFVLSGRLMAEILFIRKVPLRTFFPRRINRVYPALLAFVLVLFALTQFSDWRIGPKAVLGSLTFISNYSIWIPGLYRHGFVDHLWSLCVEEHAYVILALVVLLARAFRLSPLPMVLMISAIGFINGILSMSIFQLDYFETYWRTDVHIASISVSAAVYLWLARKPSVVLPWVSPMAFAAGLLLSANIFPPPLTYSLGTICLAVSVCTIDRSYEWFRRLFDNSIAMIIGMYSYSIYLWQQPFYQLHHAGELSMLFSLAATAAFAFGSFHLVEQPARVFLNGKFTASGRQAVLGN
ncbi:acyltransferase family protein [Paracoccus sp. Ld10]|uniref:acyltransferase family protein n=1 Tax=Paracoccus sp. Ld10 TaxID=649158 RepID=UPI0038673368